MPKVAAQMARGVALWYCLNATYGRTWEGVLPTSASYDARRYYEVVTCVLDLLCCRDAKRDDGQGHGEQSEGSGIALVWREGRLEAAHGIHPGTSDI